MSDADANEHPLLHNESIHHDEKMGTVMPRLSTGLIPSDITHSNEPGIVRHKNLVPNFSWPLSSHRQPDRDDNETPTMRQVTGVDDLTGTGDSPISTVQNVISNSPPVPQYGASSDVPEDSSGRTAGLAFAMSPTPNYGDYSFDVSGETIGLALTDPIPPGGEVMYETATEASEPFDFVMPGKSSETPVK